MNCTLDNYTRAVLDENGRPRNPANITCAVRREYLDLDFVRAMYGGIPLQLPVKIHSGWNTIKAVVERVTFFVDGALLHLKPVPGGIFNADPDNPNSWKRLYFWVANQGTSGVL